MYVFLKLNECTFLGKKIHFFLTFYGVSLIFKHIYIYNILHKYVFADRIVHVFLCLYVIISAKMCAKCMCA